MITLVCHGKTEKGLQVRHNERGEIVQYAIPFKTNVGGECYARLVSYYPLEEEKVYTIIGYPRILQYEFLEIDVATYFDAEGKGPRDNPAFLMFAGNAGRDAKHVVAESGTEFYSFSAGCPNTQLNKNEEGKWRAGTTWVNCSAFKSFGKYITKGSKIAAAGSPKFRTYKNNQGQNAATIDLATAQLEIQHKKSSDGQGGYSNGNNNGGWSTPGATTPAAAPQSDSTVTTQQLGIDNIPF